MGMTLAAASAVSGLFFHRDFLGGQGWGAFVTGVMSVVIAGVGIAVTVSLAASALAWWRRRPGGPRGRAAAS